MSTKSNPRNQGRMRRRRLALALACLLMAPAAWSQTLPDTGTVVSGAVTSDLDLGGVMNPGGGGTAMTITQTSPAAIINWYSFDVATGSTLTFAQPVGGVILNRVIGDGFTPITPSLINGTINGSGSVFIVNPTGILFGASSAVNVGGLVASTLAISDTDFLTGASGAAPHHYVFTPYPGPGAAIVNQGTLTAATGGTIALLAARIENQYGAVISAPDGSVVIGAGSGATLDFYDDGLTTVTLVGSGPDLDPGCSSSPIPTSACLGGIEIMGNITAAGDITLTVDNSISGGIAVTYYASITGGGDISLSAQGSATGIYLHDSQITSNGGDISLAADGPVHGVRLQNASVTSNSGAITMTASGSQYGVLVNYHSAVDSGGGDVTITANGSHDGININNFSTVDSGGGNIAFTADSSAMGVLIVYHAAVDSGGGDITFSGDSATQYGVLVTRYSSIYSHGGVITMHADDSRGGISLWDATLDSEGGDILLTAENAYYNSGVRVRDSSIDGGNITMDADGSAFGVYVNGSTITAAGIIAMHADNGLGIWIDDSTVEGNGDVTLHASNSGNGILVDSSQIISSGGDISLTSDGAVASLGRSIEVRDSLIDSGGGDITMTSGTVGLGITINDSSVESDGGTIALYANDGSYGIYILGLSLLDSGSGDIALHADNSDGIHIIDSTIYAGAIAMHADNGLGISIANSTVEGNGDVTLHADNSGNGILVDKTFLSSGGGAIAMYADHGASGITITNTSVESYGGAITLHAADSGAGVQITNLALIDSGSGDIAIYGSSTGLMGVYVDNSAIASHGGDIVIEGDSASTQFLSYGVLIHGGSNIASGGGDIEITGASMGGSGVWLAYIDLTSGGGNIVLNGSGVGTGGVDIYHGDVDSGGGGISIDGYSSGDATGVSLAYASLSSGAGDIVVSGGAGGLAAAIWLRGANLDSTTGDITLGGQAAYGFGVMFDPGGVTGNSITTTSGDIDIYGTSTGTVGVRVFGGSIATTSGNVSLTGEGVTFGVDLWYADISTTTGDIQANGSSSGSNGNGVRVLHSDLSTTGGSISLSGSSTGSTSRGVRVWYSDLASGGGDIVVQGDGSLQGITLYHADLSSDGGHIQMTGTGGWYGLTVSTSNLLSDGGDIALSGSGVDSGVGLQLNTVVSSNGGDIEIVGHGGQSIYSSGPNTVFGGVTIWTGSQVTSAGGDIYVLGTGANAGSFGVYLNDSGSSISSGGGLLTMAGDAAGTGLLFNADTSIDGGAGVVVLRASNDGSSDAIVLGGQIASTTAVNLRPYDATDTLYLGGGNGFVLDNIELSHISTPWLVLGSSLHQGAIQVLSDISFGGNLTLQNQGGTAGIHLAGALDVSGHTLGLLAGGDITQTSVGAIKAESLLAVALGNVLLNAAPNDVTGNTLAGKAGGDFRYLDADALSIGNVSAYGFDTNPGSMTSHGVSGIWAIGGGSGGPSGPPGGGNVLVQTQSGDLTLNADVHGTQIDLVAAGIFLNPDGHVLQVGQSGSWRIWANTWDGEDRGGLEGSGPLPNVYGCNYLGTCGTLVGNGNQFIYVQQSMVSVSETAGRPTEILAELEDGSASSSSEANAKASGMCPMTDMVADVALAGSDSLGNDWMKVRKKLNLVNCFSNNRTGGCSGF